MPFKQLFDPESSTFTYFIVDDYTHEAVIIDPVIEQVERDLKQIRENGLKLRYILETHVHADHVTAGRVIKEETAAQTAVAQDCHAQGYDRYLHDGDVILFGKEEILVIATPGHTPGSVSFLWKDRVFTGDALLIGGCGRTDFQNGSAASLYHSITEKLFRLDDQVLVYPAHDYKGRRVSSIGEEKVFNARVAGKTLEEFVSIMNSLNLPMPKHIQEAVPANLVGGISLKALGKIVDVSSLKTAGSDLRSVSVQQLAELNLSERKQIIDVRTPAEFSIARIPGSTNIPFENLKSIQLNEKFPTNTTLYCICQTGTRSLLAAEQLRAVGFQHVVHVDGGINVWAAKYPLEGSGGMSLERQVRTAAGGIVLLGIVMGHWIHPLAYWVAGFIGAGLLFSGITNTCGMATVLGKMPWNK